MVEYESQGYGIFNSIWLLPHLSASMPTQSLFANRITCLIMGHDCGLSALSVIITALLESALPIGMVTKSHAWSAPSNASI